MARPRIVPTGQMNGRQGPPGRDGVNAIPADEFIAGRLADPDSDTRAALNGLIADQLADFVPNDPQLSKLPEMLISGTITRNSDGAATSAPVLWPNGNGGSYAALVLSTAFPGLVDSWKISSVPAGVLFWDSFTRTDAEFDGSLPDYGSGVWGNTGSAALLDWSMNGTDLVRTSNTPTGINLATISGAAQDFTVKIKANLSTTATGAARSFRLLGKFVDISNYVWANFAVGTTGIAQLQLYKVIGGTSTQVGSTLTLTTVPANTASNELTMEVTVNGTAVSAKVNTETVSGTLAGGDVTALATATKGGIYTASAAAGDKIHDFIVTTPGAVLASDPQLFIQPTLTRDANGAPITYPTMIVS